MADAAVNKTLEGHAHYVWCISFSPDNKLIASASDDCTVRLWNVPSGDLNAELKGHESFVYSVAFSPDGKSIVSGSWDHTVRTWSVATKQQVKTLIRHNDNVRSVAWSPNGDVIASGSYDKTVILWDAISGLAKKTLTEHTHWVESVSFSQNGNKLVSAGWDNTAIIWDVNSGALIKLAHSDAVLSVCFSPDDQFVVTGGSDKIVRMFNANNGREEKRFKGHTSYVYAVACSFDGSMIASGSDDKAVRLWDVASTKQLQRLDGHNNEVRSVAFSRDGKFIASGSEDSTVRLWNTPSSLQTPTSLLKAACFAGDVDAAKFQLDQGALVNNKGPDGKTILQLVNQSKSAEIKAAFNNATILQNKNLKSIPALALNQSAQFTLRLANNKFGPDIWDTLTSSSACTQFLVGLFLQSNPSLGGIPDTVAKLGQLSCLSVADCGLSASSIRALALLPNLRSLDVAGNQLDDLPTEFSQLKELRILNVNKCNLSLVPAAIIQMLQLRDLDISNNPIHRIPVAITALPYLTRITLSGCPLTAIPSEYNNAPPSELLQFLKDLGENPQPVYRSKLLLVGYANVGKTTLLSALFPPSAILLKKRGNQWQQRRCKIEGNKLIYERPTGDWEKAGEIELVGAIIQADETDQMSWFILPKGQSRKFEFRCQNGLEREEWINACKFQALNRATDGISMMLRDINHAELQSVLDQAPSSPPNPAPPNWERINRVPKGQILQLALCDFSGQYEYQDGHQLFLTSRSIYLVLWDVTPTKRAAELAKLRHWLVTLQLQLGSDQLRNSVLIYIVGTHADAPDVDLDQCSKQATKVIEAVQLSVPRRLIPGIDVRNQQHVSSVKQQLLADLAVQAHLGEEVPISYLDLEQQLRVAQHQYRLQSIKQSTPLLQRADLASQLKVDVDLVTSGLSLLHLWGQIVYLGGLNSRSKLDEVVVYLPEWLTVSVLGSLVAELRKRLGRALDGDYSVPVVKHVNLIRFSSVWMDMSSEQREQVMEMFYAFDLGFPLDESATKSFEDQSSLFPQLLPLKPPRSFTWVRSNTSETARIVELNGIPMGFHTVLLSRLRSYFGGIDSSSSWQSGFVFTQDQVCTLMTIHEDSSRLRFCVRNGQNVAKFFSDLIDVLRQMLTDRYKGLRIVNEFVECGCEGCRHDHQWQWNRSIADTVEKDASINALLKDTTARSELSAAITRIVQPEGAPFEFNVVDVVNLAAKRAPSGLCQKYKNAVPLAELLSTVAIEREGNDVFISYRRDGGSDLSLLIKSKLTDKGFKVFHDVDRDDGLSAGLFDQVLVNNLKSSRCVVLLLTKGSLNRCLDGADPNNNDWVRREIAIAIENKILIIPVMSNFEWPSKERLPEDIRELVLYNAVEWSHSYAAAAIDKIASFIPN